MLQDIEERLAQLFSLAWKESEIEAWIGAARFDLDLAAINANLREPVADFLLRGGKRLRPVLFLTILKLLGADWKKYLNIAVALEVAHNGTLIIDDIEDSAELRRGKPTIHRAFGLDTAINAGVSMHFLPLRLMAHAEGISAPQKLRLLEIYTEEIVNVYFGQTLDVAWHKESRVPTEGEYLEMTRLKTGGLLRMASRAACVVAGREDLEAPLIDFSELVGVAFQIKDDALEFEGDEQTFGKSFGNDITEGKMSLPVMLALGKLPEADRAWLLATLGAHPHEHETLVRAIDLVKGTGAIGEAVRYAEKLVDESWRAIEPKLSSMNAQNTAAFKDLTYFLITRAR